jgi:hypothetical protein
VPMSGIALDDLGGLLLMVRTLRDLLSLHFDRAVLCRRSRLLQRHSQQTRPRRYTLVCVTSCCSPRVVHIVELVNLSPLSNSVSTRMLRQALCFAASCRAGVTVTVPASGSVGGSQLEAGGDEDSNPNANRGAASSAILSC